nr:unnamed protein product [Spirometra erinaceieuropaei]
MSLRLPHQAAKIVAIIASVHVQLSSITNSDETKSKLYEDQNVLLENGPKMNKLAVRSDFNACVGTDWGTCREVFCTHGFSSCNEVDLHLLQISMEHRLFLANNFFQPSTQKTATWTQPRLTRRWQLLEYVLVRRPDRQDVKVTKAIYDARGEPITISSSSRCDSV